MPATGHFLELTFDIALVLHPGLYLLGDRCVGDWITFSGERHHAGIGHLRAAKKIINRVPFTEASAYICRLLAFLFTGQRCELRLKLLPASIAYYAYVAYC